MCGLLRAKGFPWTSPAGHILVLVPRFDREFETTVPGTRLGRRQKWHPVCFQRGPVFQ